MTEDQDSIQMFTRPRTTEVTWTVQLPEKFENAIFLGRFQSPATE